MAVPFDPKTLELGGAPVRVLERVLWSGPISCFSLSASGTLVYAEGQEWDRPSTPMWVGRDGQDRSAAKCVHCGDYHDPAISPNGRQVAFSVRVGPNQDIWLHDMARETWTRLSQGAEMDMSPVWVAGGSRIVFSKGTGEGPDLVLRAGRRRRRTGASVQERGREVGDFLVRSAQAPRVRARRRHLAVEPVRLADGRTVSPDCLRRRGAHLLTQRALDRVRIQRERTIGDLCAAIARAGEKVANLDGRRPAPSMVAKRRRAALYQRQPSDDDEGRAGGGILGRPANRPNDPRLLLWRRRCPTTTSRLTVGDC